MKLHYLQHEPFEGPASVMEWATGKEATISSTHLYKGETVPPDVSGFDILLIMGGSMSVNDEAELPWLVAEKQFVKKAIEAGKIVIGICLGAQMIANVLGSKVYRNKEKEIGWFPITWEEEALRLPVFKSISKELTVLHWHGETFDLPEGALRIAQSEACVNQGFLYKGKVLALQFHMEFNEKSTEEMLLHCGAELAAGKYVQSEESIRKQIHFIPPAKKALFSILDSLGS